MEVPESLYLYFKQKPRPAARNWSLYVAHPADNRYIEGLANELSEAARARGLNRAEKAQFVANFVQSLPYTSDNVTTGYDEYPRYPLETLVDKGGDCEDTSILACALLSTMKYVTALVSPPGHMMTVLLGEAPFSGETSFSGKYYDAGEIDGKEYHFYYLETTGENFAVGQVPRGVEVEKITKIYLIAPVPIMETHFKYSRSGTSVSITVTTANLGSVALEKGYVTVDFDAGGGMVWKGAQSDPFDLPPNGTKTVTLNCQTPQGVHTRLVVNVLRVGNAGIWWDTVYSNWFDT